MERKPVRPPQKPTPVATVSIGVDAVVGGSVADFVDATPTKASADSASRRSPASAPVVPAQPAQPAEPEAPLSPFAAELAKHLEPGRDRLIDEAARLEWVRRAAAAYIPKGPPKGGSDR